MPDDDLQFWETVEHACKDESDGVQARLDLPSPRGSCEQEVDLLTEAGVVRVANRGRDWSWMNVYRDVQRLSGFEDGQKKLIVQEPSTRPAMDQRTFEAEL